ncbi:retinol dehydrogenase 13-like isoform X2 [Plodia interpunctella]|nr:retinol dehydrogenase 13-like isoform X2 [Plodia interpunctella]XP_053601210.1 retinol dehydrogenase 13-like isoform X2 [Plodia interpunctella]XP_053601211.1 retinol dehydrogenase 13-like isoform X2 [Plodia interpunctella]XP_053601212.1 retinol dehydrogenase 13-like isoform X2 [Plodia interpunctella]XP_053601213.1 retinol dehydrogenase 13-like isoform X2 [Plodia interpunctella]
MPFFSGRCYSTARLVGKTVVITGCNTGIGKETAMDFYKRGAKIIMACRSLERAEEAKKDIENKCKDLPDTGKLVVVKCDLMSLKSVRECAQNILAAEPQINILVNNAGIMMCPKGKTEDGFDIQFGTNHLAHFLFTMLLLPRIIRSKPARIVTVSSKAHTRRGLNLDDLNYDTRTYSAVEAYCRSKLANVLFSKELAAKLKEHQIEDVNTYSLHPGVIKTELGRHLNDTIFPYARQIFGALAGPFTKSPELGAQTTIYCAVDEKCANETGLYYSDCQVTSPSQMAQSDENAKKLWELSQKLVGLDFDPFREA